VVITKTASISKNFLNIFFSGWSAESDHRNRRLPATASPD
jgi:hypothetical protein